MMPGTLCEGHQNILVSMKNDLPLFSHGYHQEYQMHCTDHRMRRLLCVHRSTLQTYELDCLDANHRY